MGKDYFRCYHKYLNQCEKLTDEEMGRLFRALLLYSESGETPVLDGREAVAFDFIADKISEEKAHDEEISKKRSEAGKQKGRRKVKRAAAQGIEEKAGDSIQKQAETSESKTEQMQAKKAFAFFDKQTEANESNPSPLLPPSPSSLVPSPPDPPIPDSSSPNPPISPLPPATAANSARAREESLGQVMSAYMDRINPTPSPSSMAELGSYVKVLGGAVCLQAIDRAIDAGADKANWNYIRGILRSLEAQGVKCLSDWEAIDRKREYKRGKGAPVDQQDGYQYDPGDGWEEYSL